MKFIKIFTYKKIQTLLPLVCGVIITSSIVFPLFFVAKNNDFLIPKTEILNKNFGEESKIFKAPKRPEYDFMPLVHKFEKIKLESKNLPISEDLLLFINQKINQVKKALNGDYFLQQIHSNWNLFFENYNIWKQAFLNKDELVLSQEDQQEWNKIFNEKSKNIYSSSVNNKKIELENYIKNFYIYKLKQQIKLYEQHPYYIQPLERLKKILYYYQNNYEEYVDFQWGIDKNNKFTLEPSKYYSGNYQKIFIDDQYIKNWLKFYQRWNWVFVQEKDQINKIEDKKIKALQINPKFKDNKIISNYIKNQINFAPDRYDELWTINPQHPEKVNYNDVKEMNFSNFAKKSNKLKKQRIDEINRFGLKYNNFQIYGGFSDLNIDNKKYRNKDFQQLKKFNFKKFFKYHDNINLDPVLTAVVPDFEVYNNLLWDQPNLFSDGLYRNIKSELIKPVHTRIKSNKLIFDSSSSITQKEIKQGKSLLNDGYWINPIPEYKKWFNHWKEILPKIINNTWDDKTKIKAVAYYIITNTIYLSPTNKYFNYNGYGIYNPTQIFTNDPEIECVGYSMNLAAALTILNIPVRILGGVYSGSPLSTIANSGHAWNEVFIDGRWKAIDLTNWDLYEADIEHQTYELRDDKDLFLERNSEWMNKFKLDIASYQTTIMFFKNPKEYEYKDLPDSL
ncbi:transglutaminase-like domain-containing protein [Mycoplasmopsis citelli]|uniref:Transglutaminase-like domain-containing protein n=1 Tax=Mycoplasmopsis citelli TaxID=171281 RepID=A0A449B3A6_9BACT|nr:transglutaminase-like domain-containing protein [Mycoplasmopsis citelli]UUD36354.1 transglutaminase-like domain-containing protein [Mycoplasmopsis citelli]VEU75062.1 Uncharacterised protein [Mycoplasmopsis citelli]